ncbi:hypothetical protein CHLNCDRAFT_141680 [Chlorella variabilis]|uniref:Protein ZIP4 homolog n=1 Tax=Chlorella variabilis TaxID=554065 RepID=E1ZTD1_CHLVA|nr:hypothetical protein CHLNCDRAFT_141680 [Chlorella variabilis]EFN50881.1 hypothetical protein CHLNCDRAFT_141680 [Chlorella variabilis]|eukprot:XP_005842983.1 hypothetical protein CHLNCDRAFT_141680 [Chlorella variabilis]
MEDALASSLGRLASLASALGSNPSDGQLEQLSSACSAALTNAQGQPPGPAQQRQLWEAAAGLWNSSIDLGSAGNESGGGAEAGGGTGRRRVAATLLQAACDLCTPLAPDALLPPNQLHLAGEAWARLGELEAAEAVLSRGSEAAAALAPVAFERRGRGPRHQEAASLLFSLLLERLRAALRLSQQMLSGELISRAAEFVGDARLPPGEALALRLALIGLLREEGQRLAQAGSAAAAAPLLSAAYDALSGVELEGEEGEEGGLAAEVQAIGGQVLTLLAWCSAEAGEAERALSCLQALQQVAGTAAAAHFSSSYLSLRCLLQLGRTGEAEAQLLNLVSHEEATPEACLAGLTAALAAPGGAALARAALPMVVERFAEEPGLVVELVRAALQAATAAAATTVDAADGAAGGDPTATAGTGGGEGPGGAGGGRVGAAAQPHAPAAAAAAAAEELVLELVADDRLLESVCEPASQGAGGGGGGTGGGTLPLRRRLIALLWNHAAQRLASGAGAAAAHAFFAAVLPLLERGGSRGSTQEGCGHSDGEEPQPAACHRSMALCCLGAGQHGRALESLAAADRLEPAAVPTAMLRLTVQLAAGRHDGAAAAVATLAACPGSDADVLRLACCQCMEAGAPRAARQALECLLELCAGDAGGASSAPPAQQCQLAPGLEATAFQNLIKLLLDAPAEEPPPEQAAAAGASPQHQPAARRRAFKVAAVFDRLSARVQAAGAGAFFALEQPGGPGRAQLEWLALEAWNAGQRAGSAGALQQAAVLLAVCGELHAALPAPGAVGLHRQKMAFLMAAACACEVHEAQLAQQLQQQQQQAEAGAGGGGGAADSAPAPGAANPGAASAPAHGGSASLSLSRSYLTAARGAAAGLDTQQAVAGVEAAAGAGEGQAGPGGDAKADVYLLLLDFKLCLLGGDVAGQLQALARARALPAFGAHHFGMAAALARGGSRSGGGGGSGRGLGTGPAPLPPSSPEVCRAAEAARLHRLTQDTPLDYAAAAAALRRLVELSPGDDERLELLGEAAGLLSAAPPGAYPPQELRWLVTTAWNRGAVHARFGRPAEAGQYQRWAASALRHSAELAGEYQARGCGLAGVGSHHVAVTPGNGGAMRGSDAAEEA